jgi:hypothetical protein
MKPRIVREWAHWPEATHGSSALIENGDGCAYLALPWPEECPYTPEQVMKACEHRVISPRGVPATNGGRECWWLPIYPVSIGTVDLTPEFIGEPKWKPEQMCAHVRAIFGGDYRCASCGAVVKDRRKGQQRKGERRKEGPMYGGGRRCYPRYHASDCKVYDRRKPTDRRKP